MNKINNKSMLNSRRTLLQGLSLSLLGALPLFAWADGNSDYFKAVRFDDEARVADLLRRGFNPNTTESLRGENGLMVALREKSTKVFALLLKARAVNLDLRAKNGDTAMMLAAFSGNLPAVKALIQQGAQVNQTGWTALHYAASVGNNEIVQLLLDNYAYIDAESANKTTPLMMAARGGHILTVKLLLDEGADVGIKNNLGMTALDFAKKHDWADIVEGLTYQMKKAGKL
ncbi:MAG: ankyrin repeat domain-containing protein [Herbaspirillum sp.]